MRTVAARPYPYSFDPAHTAVVLIDMQRDFLEPGGFGAMLGNDVLPLQRIVPACQQLLALAREHGLHIIHTQEAHDPQLADCQVADPSDAAPSANADCGTGVGMAAASRGPRPGPARPIPRRRPSRRPQARPPQKIE